VLSGDSAMNPSVVRRRLRVDGTVQGVGFRPYVYRLARSLELRGFVRNDAHAVVVEVEGAADAVERFARQLPLDAPPLAMCGTIVSETIASRSDLVFRILESASAVPSDAEARMSAIAPDVATCDDCIAELFDPANRRFRYPFINCTNCGPRFTIVRGIPYDRARTTMRDFRLCEACAAEFDEPENRRFHAQPNACDQCGPRARLVDKTGSPIAETTRQRDAVACTADLLLAGAIVAIKGIGGYHLACLAGDPVAVDRLRALKRRPDRPFALMAPDLESAECLVVMNARERESLCSRSRPIVLAARRSHAPVAESVAPRHRELGVMLPYTPLHHVLLRDVGQALVMTSGNLSNEPIAYRDANAFERLGEIADAFLVHDREIERPVDDSIVRVVNVAGNEQTMIVRRSRGYVPAALPLPARVRETAAACGAQLKNTYAFATGRSSWIGPHLGDLESYETYRAFKDGIDADEARLGLKVDVLVHDFHPEYASTKYATLRADSETLGAFGVQHHHAHFAACLAEHDETGPAIGVIFDGTGLGDAEQGGGVWGGEILVGDVRASRRAAHLWPVVMPGGERAISEPWRMACAWLTAAGGRNHPPLPRLLEGKVSRMAWENVARLCRSGMRGEVAESVAPITTSAGRLLDAIAAVCGFAPTVTYEGQAAIELEAVADRAERQRYEIWIVEDRSNGRLVLDVRDLLRAVVRDLQAGVDVARVSARVHNGLAFATAECCARLQPRTVALSGGVFQNALLLERTSAHLAALGFTVLVPRRLPVNDGGISYGQLAAFAAQHNAETH